MTFNRHRTYTDLELQRMYREGEEGAFGPLLEPHIRPIMGYARTLTQDDHEAEDLSFRVFQELAETIRKGTDVTNVGGYLRKMIRNRFIDHMRSQQTRTNRLLTELLEEEREEAAEEVPYDSERDHQRDILILEIDRLNEEQRYVIAEKYFFGQDPKAIAAEANWPEKKVYNLLNGARKTLRRRCLRSVK